MPDQFVSKALRRPVCEDDKTPLVRLPPLDIVAAIVRREDGRLLITKRHECDHLGGVWEFPGGKVEPGESPEGALSRELREEVNIQAIVTKENFYREVKHEYPDRSLQLFFYRVTEFTGELIALEVADMRWVAPSELCEYEFPEADRQLLADLGAECG